MCDVCFLAQNLRVLDAYLLYEMDLYSEFLLSNEEHRDEMWHKAPTGGSGTTPLSSPAASTSPSRSPNNVFLHQLELKGSGAALSAQQLQALNTLGLYSGNTFPRSAAWKEHRAFASPTAAAGGAGAGAGVSGTGTRARSTAAYSYAKNVHSNEGRELEDAEMQARATSLAEQVCFSMYEMSRQSDEVCCVCCTLD
jgi:hypothetical protein